jgi:hypothetical protein
MESERKIHIATGILNSKDRRQSTKVLLSGITAANTSNSKHAYMHDEIESMATPKKTHKGGG